MPLLPLDMRHPSAPALPPTAPDSLSGLPQTDLVAAIPRLRRYARVLTGNSASADDLVQDTLARAWDKRRLWRAGSDLRAWLFTIMHNVHANQRARARHEAASVSLDSHDEQSAALQVAEYGNQLLRVELREAEQHVARLPAEQREVLLLVAVEELRYEEVAAVLAIPVGTVMSRLSRARDRLRRITKDPSPSLKVVADRRHAAIAS